MKTQREAIEYAINVLRQVEGREPGSVSQCGDAIAGLNDILSAVPLAPPASAVLPRLSLQLMEALARFEECCADAEAGGHDVEKDDMIALAEIGAVRPAPFGRHYMTDFGRYLLASRPAELPFDGEAPVSFGAGGSGPDGIPNHREPDFFLVVHKDGKVEHAPASFGAGGGGSQGIADNPKPKLFIVVHDNGHVERRPIDELRANQSGQPQAAKGQMNETAEQPVGGCQTPLDEKSLRRLALTLRIRVEKLAELLTKAETTVKGIVEADGETVSGVRMGWGAWALLRGKISDIIEAKCELDAAMAAAALKEPETNGSKTLAGGAGE